MSFISNTDGKRASKAIPMPGAKEMEEMGQLLFGSNVQWVILNQKSLKTESHALAHPKSKPHQSTPTRLACP